LSKVRSLRLTDTKVFIGDNKVDQDAEREAEELLKSRHPDLRVVVTPEGKRQMPLQDLLGLERQQRQERDEAERSGFQRGREAGYVAGLEKGREEARKVVASLSGMLTDITAQRHGILEEAKEKILELVLKISQRLTFSAAEADPEITMAIISGAVNQLLDKSRIKVKVNPRHLPELEQHIDRFRGADTAIKEFAFEADPRVRAGGCFIETPAGDVDARLESMYDIIAQAMHDRKDIVG